MTRVGQVNWAHCERKNKRDKGQFQEDFEIHRRMLNFYAKCARKASGEFIAGVQHDLASDVKRILGLRENDIRRELMQAGHVGALVDVLTRAGGGLDQSCYSKMLRYLGYLGSGADKSCRWFLMESEEGVRERRMFEFQLFFPSTGD
jgi:hypothetical protein